MSEPPRILFTLEGASVRGVLQKLSMTGGCARMSRQCVPGTLAELKINTAVGRLEALVEMLPPEQIANEQPFRFVAMDDSDQQLLTSTVTRLRKMGYAEGTVCESF
jgi:hypothetical protein